MNAHLRSLIVRLEKAGKKNKAGVWLSLAETLNKPTRIRPEVTVGLLSKAAGKGDVIAVPGAVVGASELKHALTVAAWRFTKGAREAITKAGGKCIDLDELVKANAKGTGVRIFT